MTAVKICGMRCPADLECCAKADYLGFVVLAESPRALELGSARGLMSSCDNIRVAVTTERSPRELKKLVRYLEPDVLQLHSPLDLELLIGVADLGVPIWGMLPVRPVMTVERDDIERCQALVLDSPGDRDGGNGLTHDWDRSRRIREDIAPFPVVLAGGLGPENVVRAVNTVRPFAVDISSGVEGNCGKDPEKVGRLLEAIKRVDEK